MRFTELQRDFDYLMIEDIYDTPQITYMIGEESFWEGTGYENLLLTKDESNGSFSSAGGSIR